MNGAKRTVSRSPALQRAFAVAFVAMAAVLLPMQASAVVALADQPFTTSAAPGNLILTPSVEWPTASTPAHLSTTAYSAASTYVGYFDPAKCYRYTYNSTTPSESYFAPAGAATNHACTSASGTPLWSGNYLNWSSTQTIDAFRWALTGGPRVVDTTTETVLEKTNHTGQGNRSGIYPDKVITSGVSGASPFNWTGLVSRVYGLGTAMYFSNGQAMNCTFSTNSNRRTTFNCDASSTGGGSASCNTGNSNPATGGSASCTAALSSPSGTLSCTVNRPANNSYQYSCTTSISGGAACSASASYSSGSASASCATDATVTDYTNQSSADSTASSTTFYKAYVRIKVCDPAIGLESNCKQYGSNYKPEGLMQQYAMKLRYSIFGYLNDDNIQRDGGVMRARMKYIGPQQPVPGSSAITNAAYEWDGTTGIMRTNPDPTDASDTQSAAASAGYTVPVTNSGVMNYLNKFGKVVTGFYKSYDPVGEMYYAATRYFRNLGNVSAYSNLGGAGSQATLARWIDGFPVISTWDDPILYSCQKNFILGIGDVYTHRDRNLPGSTITSGDEPAVPSAVSGDTSVDVTVANNMVGQLEGTANLPAACGTNLGNCSSGRNNSYYMAGLAYDAHTKDIRTDIAGPQTVSTYWLDVMENQTYESKNQYWLAAKYGGFEVPNGFLPYAATNGTSTIADSAWWTSTDMAGGDKRPDNYFLANQADVMVSGLTKAFAKISAEAEKSVTTAFSTTTAKVSSTGTASYSANYDPTNWTGMLTGWSISFGSTGTPTLTQKWDAQALLDATAHGDRKIVTCCTSTNAALPFRAASLSAATLSARTNYASFGSVPGIGGTQSQSNFVEYLRGNRNQEMANGGAYRTRAHVLGDIVGSKVNPVGPPSAPYFDLTNPGYSAFKRTYATRKTVAYVGANDGMMHAFDGTLPGASACSTCGTELFAYVPSFAYNGATNAATTGLASLGNPAFSHHYLVDATPQTFDVDFKFTNGSTATANDWRTILIGGLGKGGRGYYAIDVTDPTSWTTETAIAGKVLWEFTHAHMGFSYGEASVVKTKKYGWVVILTSGYNNDDGYGYFFIVNPRTGALLQAVQTPTAADGMAHHTAFVPDFGDFTADAVYAGDAAGNVWRLDLTATTGDYPAPTKIATLANGAAQPVTTRPLVEIDPSSKKRYVLIGTGRLLADTDINNSQAQAFYAIIDGTSAAGGFYTGGTGGTLPSGVTFPVTRANLNANTNLLTGVGSSPTNPMGWYVDIGTTSSTAGERVNVTPVANLGVLAFAVNRPTAQACSGAGSGYVVAVTFNDGKSVLTGSGGYVATSTTRSFMITELAIVAIDGNLRLLAGGSGTTTTTNPDGSTSTSATPNIENLDANFGGAITLRRLNWREVPTVD